MPDRPCVNVLALLPVAFLADRQTKHGGLTVVAISASIVRSS